MPFNDVAIRVFNDLKSVGGIAINEVPESMIAEVPDYKKEADP